MPNKQTDNKPGQMNKPLEQLLNDAGTIQDNGYSGIKIPIKCMDTAPYGVSVISLEGRYIYMNPRFTEMFGYSLDDIPSGREWFEKSFPKEQYRKEADSLWKKVFQSANMYESEQGQFKVTCKDSSVKDIIIRPMVIGKGHFLVTYEDIAETAGYRQQSAQAINTPLGKNPGGLEAGLITIGHSREGAIEALSYLSALRDPHTEIHQIRVANLAYAIAEEMGIEKGICEEIKTASMVHDIGKVIIPAEILSKPSSLNSIEYMLIMGHSQAGYDTLCKIKSGQEIAEMILQHHERMDGSGYPQGISGEKIILGARIIAVADVVEAMASHRPYRPQKGLEKALEEISCNMGILYDENVVKACLSVFSKGFILDTTTKTQEKQELIYG